MHALYQTLCLACYRGNEWNGHADSTLLLFSLVLLMLTLGRYMLCEATSCRVFILPASPLLIPQLLLFPLCLVFQDLIVLSVDGLMNHEEQHDKETESGNGRQQDEIDPEPSGVGCSQLIQLCRCQSRRRIRRRGKQVGRVRDCLTDLFGGPAEWFQIIDRHCVDDTGSNSETQCSTEIASKIAQGSHYGHFLAWNSTL